MRRPWAQSSFARQRRRTRYVGGRPEEHAHQGRVIGVEAVIARAQRGEAGDDAVRLVVSGGGGADGVPPLRRGEGQQQQHAEGTCRRRHDAPPLCSGHGLTGHRYPRSRRRSRWSRFSWGMRPLPRCCDSASSSRLQVGPEPAEDVRVLAGSTSVVSPGSVWRSNEHLVVRWHPVASRPPSRLARPGPGDGGRPHRLPGHTADQLVPRPQETGLPRVVEGAPYLIPSPLWRRKEIGRSGLGRRPAHARHVQDGPEEPAGLDRLIDRRGPRVEPDRR